jgi:hypothetical protein
MYAMKLYYGILPYDNVMVVEDNMIKYWCCVNRNWKEPGHVPQLYTRNCIHLCTYTLMLSFRFLSQ